MASHVIEFEGMQLYAPILFVLVFLLFFTVLLFLIRRAIVKRSGGPFLPLSILAVESSISMSLCVSVVAASH